ncbi:MAG: sulfatase-like hydrolase/transferase, partial [Phycisphaerae bacterium]
MAGPVRPNFLVFLTDQQRWDALGCSGNEKIRTPNLDRLAAEGTYFRLAHTTNPICIPARASLISGCWGLQTGILRNQSLPTGCLEPRFVTLPQILSRAGYFCQAIGKMHFVPPRNHYGFGRMWLMEEVPRWRHDDEY